ncbi:MAG TPA: hypothetical protein VM241_03605 [Candidatus Thermoplasmatota archaeon]|nr:hypothetical protein [Candidatus Thermoplasmatota archaeon]
MAEDSGKPDWKGGALKYILAPLIVGVVVTVAGWAIVQALTKGPSQEISYQISGPTTLFSGTGGLADAIAVMGDEKTNTLVSYQVRVWNSGDVSLKNIGVFMKFDGAKPNFKLYRIANETNPPYEFGVIHVESPDIVSRRFSYDLLNPGDEHKVTFLANGTAILKIFAKADGLHVRQVSNEGGNKKSLFEDVYLMALLATTSAVVMESIPRFWRIYKKKNRR